MKKISLFLPIFWSLMAMWDIYRLLTNLSELKAQATWITIGDIVCVVLVILLAIYWWIMFIKGKKNDVRKDEKE